jgi:ferritin-like metal-binding protein YciE
VPRLLSIFERFGNLHGLLDLTLETVLTEARHGLVFRRHANDEGSLPAQASDRKSPSRYGLEGDRCPTQKGLKQTKGQIKRLNQAFKKLKVRPQGTKCPAIEGIIDEANEIASEVDDKMVLNAALIAAAQAVEHYEITRYGTLVAWARLLGHSDVARVLNLNLKEEKATDKKLNGIAKRKINRKAAARQRKRPGRLERHKMR